MSDPAVLPEGSDPEPITYNAAGQEIDANGDPIDHTPPPTWRSIWADQTDAADKFDLIAHVLDLEGADKYAEDLKAWMIQRRNPAGAPAVDPTAVDMTTVGHDSPNQGPAVEDQVAASTPPASDPAPADPGADGSATTTPDNSGQPAPAPDAGAPAPAPVDSSSPDWVPQVQSDVDQAQTDLAAGNDAAVADDLNKADADLASPNVV